MNVWPIRLYTFSNEVDPLPLDPLTGNLMEQVSSSTPYRRLDPSPALDRHTRREMKRRAAVEPVIGHTKAEHRMGRNYLKGHDGDRSNAVLAAAGYTSASSCAGWRGFCASCSGRSFSCRPACNLPKNRCSAVLQRRR